jgi:riboflavin kinase, archaea type
LKPADVLALYKLAELGAREKEVLCSTENVAREIGTSQQTASRRLIEMERAGLIQRIRDGRNQRVRITSQGLEELAGMYQVLKRVFETSRKELVMTGTVFTGLSEGSYYMGLEGYRKQFRSKLGFDPYPGTLNLRIRKEDLQERKLLENFPHIYIEGFANAQRSYGPAKCFRAVVNEKVQAAIVLPIRAHYGEDVVELIASQALRRLLRLKEGDLVRVRVTTKA